MIVLSCMRNLRCSGNYFEGGSFHIFGIIASVTYPTFTDDLVDPLPVTFVHADMQFLTKLIRCWRGDLQILWINSLFQ